MEQDERQTAGKKRTRSITPITVAQTIYLVGRNYLRNSLVSHARACAFAFLFSFIPIFMMSATVLTRILHASPETIPAIFALLPELAPYIDLAAVIDFTQTTHGIGWFEIVIGTFVFWAARSLFATIFQGLHDIFHREQQPRPVPRLVIMLIIEAATVVLIAAIVLFLVFMRTIITLPVLHALKEKLLPVTTILFRYHVNRLPNVLLFLVVATLYKTGSGTKPPLKACLLCALLCDLSFWGCFSLIRLAVDVSRYALVYGVLANLIVTMLDVFIFFVLFFVFAQLLFVWQFFDDLLLGELYLLPRQDAQNMNAVRRILFIRPDYLLAKDVNVIHLKKGDTIFTPDDRGTDAYYLARGTVQERRQNGFSFYARGDFLGEASCLYPRRREATATCETDVDLVRIDAPTFRAMVAKNGEVARKLLGHISTAAAPLYGLTDRFSL